MNLKSIERDFILGNEQVYREFDNSQFISNARMSISKEVHPIQIPSKFNFYSSMLQKSLEEFKSIELDQYSLKNFLQNSSVMSLVDTMNLKVKDIDKEYIISIKPQYIYQYIKLVQEEINRFLSDTINDIEYHNIVSNSMSENVKKQAVNTTLKGTPLEISSLKLNDVSVTSNYLQSKVIPYVTSFPSLKASTISEVEALIKTIEDTENMILTMQKVVEKIKNSKTYGMDGIYRISQISFNLFRSIIDVISYVTFMMIYKLNTIECKVLSCKSLYTDMLNNTVTESDMITLIPENSESLADYLMMGKSDYYDSFTDNLIRYYSNIIDLSDMKPDYLILRTVYGIYEVISNGLSIIGEQDGSQLMVYDEIIGRSGIDLPLKERFKSEIVNIEDTTRFGDMDAPNANAFVDAMKEVFGYRNSMEKVADIILIAKNKINTIDSQFSLNVNNMYRDEETIRELKKFVLELSQDYVDFTVLIASKLYNRLKYIGQILSKTNPEKTGFDDTHMDDTDYIEYAFKDIFENTIENNKKYFHALESSYFIEKALALRGTKVVFEDGENQNSSDTVSTANSTDKTGDKSSTSPTIQDNSGEGKNGGAFSKLKANVGKFIKNIVNKFNEVVNKSKTKNDQWINSNEQSLLNRSYNNVTVNILPYNNVSKDQIIKDIQSLSTNIGAMNLQNLNSINKESDLYNRLCPFVKGLKPADGNNSVSVAEQIKNYYKVGTGSIQTVSISNGELKREMSEVIIPFIKSYTSDFNSSLQKSLDDLGKKCDEQIKSYGGVEDNSANDSRGNTSGNNNGQPKTESVSIFEDGENSNQDAKTSDKGIWMNNLVRAYTGAVLNAVRDRYQDYLKVVSSLVPKNSNNNQQNNNTEQQQNNSDNENNTSGDQQNNNQNN